MTTHNPQDFYKYRNINVKDTIVTSNMLKHRLNLLQEWSESFEGFYPNEIYKEAYWHCKVPILDSIVNRDATFEIKKACIQYLVNAVCYILIAKKRNNIQEQSKTMCLISIPRMFCSEVTVFVDQEYYEHFFIRTTAAHKLTLIMDANRSLLKKFEIMIPDGIALQESGYIETINDEDENYQGELWAIGQLGAW